eukprot:scaffold13094_cov70-Phaeocystis_antarctica.AAC.13
MLTTRTKQTRGAHGAKNSIRLVAPDLFVGAPRGGPNPQPLQARALCCISPGPRQAVARIFGKSDWQLWVDLDIRGGGQQQAPGARFRGSALVGTVNQAGMTRRFPSRAGCAPRPQPGGSALGGTVNQAGMTRRSPTRSGSAPCPQPGGRLPQPVQPLPPLQIALTLRVVNPRVAVLVAFARLVREGVALNRSAHAQNRVKELGALQRAQGKSFQLSVVVAGEHDVGPHQRLPRELWMLGDHEG